MEGSQNRVSGEMEHRSDSQDKHDSEAERRSSFNSNNGQYREGRWSDEEHNKFLEAIHLYGKNWNKVHEHIGTRTSAQTRSHA